jgi:hypothetical protein
MLINLKLQPPSAPPRLRVRSGHFASMLTNLKLCHPQIADFRRLDGEKCYLCHAQNRSRLKLTNFPPPRSPRVDAFAPAQLIRRVSRPAPPSELPCGSLSRPFPKVSIHPCFGQPSAVFLRFAPNLKTLRASASPREICSGC